jgi:predicted transposase/invertase (TIGR01784 family)
MIPGIDPRVDYVFKRLFGSASSEPLLLSFLDAVLQPPPDERVVSLEIRDPFNPKETPDDKLSIVDVKARDQRGRQYNIEMQMRGSPTYPDRVLYYWAVLHGEHLREGQDYGRLQPTISISIVNDVLFPMVPDYHLDFRLRSSKHHDLLLSAHQAVHVLELPKFQKGPGDLSAPLDAWLYFMIHGVELDTEGLPESMCVPSLQKAMEVLEIMSKNEVEWERYQARLKFQRDQNMYVKDAHDEGVEKGKLIGRIHLCQQLLQLPVTPQSDLLAQTLDDLSAMTTGLEAKALNLVKH